MPYRELDSLGIGQAQQDAVLKSTSACENWRACHPHQLFVPMGIGVVLGPTGGGVSVPIVEEFKIKAPNLDGYVPQSRVKNYLEGVAVDFGYKDDAVAKIGTLGATGALSAAVAFLNQGQCLKGFSGYGLAGRITVVRPVDSWDNLDGVFMSQGLPVRTFYMWNRKGELDPSDLEAALWRVRQEKRIPLLYLQSDAGNMTGYHLPGEMVGEIAKTCSETGAIVLAECVYRGTSAGKKWEIACSYMENDLALVRACTNLGVPIFWTHSESKRGNFPGRVGALLHVPRKVIEISSIQSQLSKMARVNGFWFLPETFIPYEEIYRRGAAEELHKGVCEATVARIIESAEENSRHIPRGPLKTYWEKLRGLTRIIPVKEGAAERLLHGGVGSIMFDRCETDSGPAIRVNTTGNLSYKGKGHLKKLWKAINEEYRPFVIL